MILKKWSGTEWVAQPVTTTAQSVVTAMGGPSVFDTNDKLLPKYLPDMALAGMRFTSTLTAAEVDTAAKVLAIMDAQVVSTYLQTPTPSTLVMHGIYWIASAADHASFPIAYVAGTGGVQHLTTGRYYCIIGTLPGEEGQTALGSQLNVESGDWIIIQKFTGVGTTADPYIITLGVINNTYGIMTGSAYGVARTGYTTNAQNYAVSINDGRLFVNVPWTNTVYTHPNHTGDVTSTGDGATVIAANAVTTAKIIDDAVTNAKLANMAANTIKGAVSAGGPVDLTPLQVRTMINVADGATANTGTVTSVAASAGTGITVSGSPITTSGTITITNSAPNATHTGDVTGSAALTIAANVVSNTKLADVAGFTVKGKNTTGSGDPVDMTAAQLRSMIDTIQTFSGTTAPVSTVGMLTGAIWFDG